jgi:SRSO17 transposase
MIQNLMTGGASTEHTLMLWASSLREAKRRIRPLFTQDRVAISAGQFLDALLSNEPRKTGWMRAEAAGDGGPWRQQALLGRGRWDADALRNIVRDYGPGNPAPRPEARTTSNPNRIHTRMVQLPANTPSHCTPLPP